MRKKFGNIYVNKLYKVSLSIQSLCIILWIFILISFPFAYILYWFYHQNLYYFNIYLLLFFFFLMKKEINNSTITPESYTMINSSSINLETKTGFLILIHSLCDMFYWNFYLVALHSFNFIFLCSIWINSLRLSLN